MSFTWYTSPSADIDLVGTDAASRIGQVLTRSDIEFPVVPRASDDLPVAHAAHPARLVGSRLVGAAEQARAQRGALVRAVIDDRVQRTAHVVDAHAELPDVDQLHAPGGSSSREHTNRRSGHT